MSDDKLLIKLISELPSKDDLLKEFKAGYQKRVAEFYNAAKFPFVTAEIVLVCKKMIYCFICGDYGLLMKCYKELCRLSHVRSDLGTTGAKDLAKGQADAATQDIVWQLITGYAHTNLLTLENCASVLRTLIEDLRGPVLSFYGSEYEIEIKKLKKVLKKKRYHIWRLAAINADYYILAREFLKRHNIRTPSEGDVLAFISLTYSASKIWREWFCASIKRYTALRGKI